MPRTATIPQSPPKRVTRARTRGATSTKQTTEQVETAPEPKPKSSSKAATGKTASTATKTSTKSKKTEKTKAATKDIIEPRTRTTRTRAEEVQEEDSDDDDELEIVKSVNTKTKGGSSTTRSRVAAPARPAVRGTRSATALAGNEEDDEDDDDELGGIESPKKRGTRARAPTKKESDAPAPKRGRPAKKATASKSSRTRTAASTNAGSTRTVIPTASVAAAKAKAAAAEAPKKKKVTFMDAPTECDKENQPLPPSTTATGEKKATVVEVPATGLKAKPVRSTGRGRKDGEDRKDVQPLSPKKATQVAKSGSSSGDDEDELSGAKTPMRTMQRSPVKGSSLSRSLGSPVKKIDIGATGNTPKDTAGLESANEIVQGLVSISNPAENSYDNAILASPPRRLPPTPYKDAIKDSPKRNGLVIEDPATSNHQLALRPHSSPLKTSPKKGNLGASFNQSPLKSSGTPFNAKISLLQSPAKRAPSPFKPLVESRNAEQDETSKADMGMDVDEDADATAGFEASRSEFSTRGEDTDGDVFNDDPVGVDFEKSVLEIGEPLHLPEENVHEHAQYMDVNEEGDNDELDQVFNNQNDIDCPFTVEETLSAPTSPAPAPQYEGSVRSLRNIPPPAPSPPAQATVNPSEFAYRWEVNDEGSDDELMPGNSPIRRRSTRFHQPTTPGRRVNDEDDHLESAPGHAASNREKDIGFTPLVAQLSKWNPSTPGERKQDRSQGKGIFSPYIAATKGSRKSLAPRKSGVAGEATSQTFFEDEMAVREDEESDDGGHDVGDDGEQSIVEEVDDDDDDAISDFRPENDNDEIYGDENAAPAAESTIQIDPKLFEEDNNNEDSEDDKENNIHPPAPMSMSMTPVRRDPRTPRTIHTVSKVPLKQEGEVSPIKVPKKRSRSLSSYAANNPAPSLSGSKSAGSLSARKVNNPRQSKHGSVEEQTPQRAGSWSRGGSPSKSPRKNIAFDSQVLRGAVVYADVHTTDGADASGIFVELLNQMGARCVKNWTWNPRMSLSPIDGVDPKEVKVGITHVIFKDGGIRTLEKVKETSGLVKCVGVGWVLDCERENKWLDESDYAVDLSLLPRGGHKRRKSMEPRALSNVNGTLVKLDSSTPSASSRRAAAEWGTMEEFIRLSPTPPSSPRESTSSTDQQSTKDQADTLAATPKPSRSVGRSSQVPETPAAANYDFDDDNSSIDTLSQSPTTPYYLSKGAKLVQQTCPPKQLRQGLFPVSGRIEDQPDHALRIRLEAARRKSLVWKPKVGSPLGR